ncbi:MAG TPA: RHS repeat-associated core domain-containing protein, partial [Nocardioidaceae bacterium]|nr:RHS repeat-associated core domain-containing protein [Nocardioidaceae bacterium]
TPTARRRSLTGRTPPIAWTAPTGSLRRTDPLGRTRASSYTPDFDTASTTSGSGATTSFGYAANGGESLTGITSPTGASVSAAYANTGPAQFLPSSSTDAQGNQTSFGYDGVGNQTSATNSTTTAAAEVTYHPDGVVATSTAPGGGTTSYTRDPATHQITAITPPADSSLGTKTLAWDEFGRLASVTDGRGITTSYTYDLLDRVIEIGYSDTTPSVTYTYDTAGNTTSRTDGSGPAANTVDYGHDGLDRLTSRTASTGGGTIAYTYDDAGNLTGTSDAGGTTTYRYDTANQAVSQTTSAGAIIDYAYDADGNRTDTWFDTNPDHTSFAAHTHTDYDDAQRVTRTWTARGSDNTARVFDTSYCHSPHTPGEPCPTGSASSDTGLIQYSTDHLSGARADYSYDAANRLVAVSNFNGHDYAYSYDIVGNRTSLTVDGTLTQQLSFNAGNQITSPGYGYDAAGNRTGDPDAETLVYDAANRMTAKTGTRNSTYTYAGPDATELVARDASGSSTYAYTYGRTDTNGLPLLETFTRNDKQYNIDYTPDGTPIALHLPSGSQHFYALNYQGTTTALIDDTGTTSATYTYTPYGDTLTATGPGHAVGVNFIRHTAGFTDADSGTGWTKHGIRWNDTTTGTWTTQDPLTRLLNPNAGNRYTYANSNPCNNTDPTGRIPTCTKATIGGAIGGAATGALAGAAGAPFTVGASVGVSALAGGLLGGFGAGIACLTVELF